MNQGVTMSNKEIARISVMEKLKLCELNHSQASKLLGISIRQSKRLKRKYILNGALGLAHQSRGKPSNIKISEVDVEKVIAIIKKDYADFGPTFAHEKLVSRNCISFSVERLRQAMIKAGLWQEKHRKKERNHPTRERRPCIGELVQIDGSPHRWFEGRGMACTLIAYIDDATSKVMSGLFVDSESTWSYFDVTERYINKHGKPLAFYSDKHGVFRINASKDGVALAKDSHGDTQFGRAIKNLGIKIIHAHSPQAKGRVERLFETLQDRLVKEMRLLNISTIADANAYLPKYLEAHNLKYAVKPKEVANLHTALDKSENLAQIFTKQEERFLSKTLSCQYKNKLYQVNTKKSAYLLGNVKVTVLEAKDGSVSLIYKGKILDYSIIKKQPKTIDADHKEINPIVDKIKAKHIHLKPAPNHPWRRLPISNKERSLVSS